MKKAFFLFLHLSLFLNTAVTYSQTSTFKNEFGFQSDNDAYLALGQDRYYTNGLFITFRHATDQSKLADRLNKKIWEAEFGHEIYNPLTGKITDVNDIDRPFAAFIYAGGSINWLYDSENSLKLTVQAGTIGPAALGKEVQETMHNLVNFYDIMGWEYQVNNELGVNTSLSYNHFINRNSANNTDLTLTSYINAGNTFAGAGLGLLFRTGTLNQLFNSVSTGSTIANNPAASPLNNKELFFFLKPTLHIVAYDATIQGGMFNKNKGPVTFGAKPIVFSQELGVNYTSKRWTLKFELTFKSKEVKSNARAHQYGSAGIYYRFN